jgi:hypothetical protein
MSRALVPAEYVDIPGYAPALASFLRRRCVGKAGARMNWAHVYAEFAGRGWRSQPSPRAFAAAMAYLCRVRGVRIETDGTNVWCVGCTLLPDNSTEGLTAHRQGAATPSRC